MRHWKFGDNLRSWHNKRWNIDGVPFKKQDGLIMPCSIQDTATGEFASIIAAYCDFVKLDQRELKRLVSKALFHIQYPKDYRA